MEDNFLQASPRTPESPRASWAEDTPVPLSTLRRTNRYQETGTEWLWPGSAQNLVWSLGSGVWALMRLWGWFNTADEHLSRSRGAASLWESTAVEVNFHRCVSLSSCLLFHLLLHLRDHLPYSPQSRQKYNDLLVAFDLVWAIVGNRIPTIYKTLR